jgi:hypothetical protein
VDTFAIVFELTFPPDEDCDVEMTKVGWACSDGRNWVQAGLFRRAMLLAEEEPY